MTTRTQITSPARTNQVSQRRTLARSSTATLLRFARARAGLSQIQLAHLAGTSQPAVARYERGIIRPRSDTLERLLEACGAAPGDLSRPDRPLLGPIGMLCVAKRRTLAQVLNVAGITRTRVVGPVADALDDTDTPLELAVTLPEGFADALDTVATELSGVLEHQVILHDMASLDPVLLQGARTL